LYVTVGIVTDLWCHIC